MKNLKSGTSKEQIDAIIETEREKILSAAYTKGKHWGMQNLPALHGDTLANYLIEPKAQCERLLLKILYLLQPAKHMPQGKIEANWSNLHHKRLGSEAEDLEKRITFLSDEIGEYSPAPIANRVLACHLIIFGLFIAEVILNTQAFQLFGDNQLYCLLLASSVSFAVGLGAHFAGRQFKDAKTNLKRWLVVIVSFVCISVFSFFISSLRSIFQKKIGIDINPMDFTIINVGLFAMAALASYYFYPTREELDRNQNNLQKLKELKKLSKEKKAKVLEQVKHERDSKDAIFEHMDKTMDAEYAIHLVLGVYTEAIGKTLGAIMLCRKEVPDCFSQTPPPLNIPKIDFYSTANRYKNPTNDNNNENDNNSIPA